MTKEYNEPISKRIERLEEDADAIRGQIADYESWYRYLTDPFNRRNSDDNNLNLVFMREKCGVTRTLCRLYDKLDEVEDELSDLYLNPSGK